VRATQKGRKKYIKTLKKLFIMYLGSRFRQWREMIRQRDEKEYSLERAVVVKWQRRMLKLAWARYIEQCKKLKEVERQNTQGCKVRDVVIFRSKKRMFGCLRIFVSRHKTAKLFFKKTVKQADIRAKKKYFTRWRLDVESDQVDEKADTQNMLVDEISESSIQAGNMRTKHLSQEKALKRSNE